MPGAWGRSEDSPPRWYVWEAPAWGLGDPTRAILKSQIFGGLGEGGVWELL